MAAWLWVTLAAPAGAEGAVAAVGGGAAILLSCAAAIVAHQAATARLLRERAMQAARLEAEAQWLATEILPALGRRAREGMPTVDALAGVPRPSGGSLHELLKAAGHELDLLAREAADARAAGAVLEGEVVRLADEALPELVKRMQTNRLPADAALREVRQPVHGPLRGLLTETARQLSEGERKGAAAMRACAGAAARVQAQSTSLLARLRELEEQYGDHEDVFADLLDLDHRVSQLSRLADNIALLSGGRSGRRWTRPIPMESILRGAMGRIGAYRRMRMHSTSTVAVAGYAAEGVMHTLAELMDNAAAFSAHGTEVHVYVEEEDTGVVVTIEDSGLGMRPRERQRATKLVSEPLDLRTLSGTRLGLAVVGRLVDKYGLTVSFRPSARGGTGVVVLVPRRLITQPGPAVEPPAAEPPARPALPEPVNAEPDSERPDESEATTLPKRRRGQTLAEATRTAHVPAARPVRDGRDPAARPVRDGRDPAARLAAFRQAGERGRTAPSSSDS
ncbi:sensor histidine kinase [Nonomuraea basaltis]|uniref:sensor histidine kinase n=1 Tax=Nonomuraea basaltis TaxID=2495887 RepID=UPI001F0FD73F|nr:ATP-binding protein [Nonomuraea basaltis]